MRLMVQCPQVNHHLLLLLRGLMTCDENNYECHTNCYASKSLLLFCISVIPNCHIFRVFLIIMRNTGENLL